MNSTDGDSFGTSPFGGQPDPFTDGLNSAAAATERLRPRPSSPTVTVAWMLGALLVIVALGIGIALVIDANRGDTGSSTNSGGATTAMSVLKAGPALPGPSSPVIVRS